jgi:hypothetical protein
MWTKDTWRHSFKISLVMVVFTLRCCATWPFLPWTHLNFSVTIVNRLYLCPTLVLGGSTHYLELYWLWKPCLGWSWGLSPCHVMLATWPFSPWTHLKSSVTIFDCLYIVFHIGVGWQHPLLGTLLASCGNHHVSGIVMVVFTLSCCATWPFSPWTHLNSSVTIFDCLYIVFYIGVGW